MMYAPSDVRVIAVHTDNGGCGVPHELGDARTVECPPCEAWLQSAGTSLGWANHPGGVALTCDEIAQSERDEREAKRVGMSNLASQLALAVSGGQPAQAQPSILQQILSMPADERAALLALLGSQSAPAALEAAPVAESEPAASETAGAAPEQPKRASRPRKATAAAAA